MTVCGWRVTRGRARLLWQQQAHADGRLGVRLGCGASVAAARLGCGASVAAARLARRTRTMQCDVKDCSSHLTTTSGSTLASSRLRASPTACRTLTPSRTTSDATLRTRRAVGAARLPARYGRARHPGGAAALAPPAGLHAEQPSSAPLAAARRPGSAHRWAYLAVAAWLIPAVAASRHGSEPPPNAAIQLLAGSPIAPAAGTTPLCPTLLCGGCWCAQLRTHPDQMRGVCSQLRQHGG
jgi:hypothetical protein